MFFKMAAIPTNFHHISAYSGHTVVILMAIPRFFGLEESICNNYLYVKYNRARVTAIFFQNGCHSNQFSPYLSL